MTAIYTAYLFAQAKARDLWQSPLLPGHLVVQGVLAGAGALAPVAAAVEPGALRALLWIVAGSSVLHLLIVWGETTISHVTAHAGLAVAELTRGRYRPFFLAGLAGAAVGLLGPWVGWVAGVAALAGLAAYEHAYVQAGQRVPLA
jgi:hypothetical protein